MVHDINEEANFLLEILMVEISIGDQVLFFFRYILFVLVLFSFVDSRIFLQYIKVSKV